MVWKSLFVWGIKGKDLTYGFLPNYTENLVKVILFINIFVLFLIGKKLYLFYLTSNHNLSISLF